MRRALFVASVFTGHREIEAVIHAFAREGMALDVVVGWAGDTARAAAQTYAALPARVHRPPTFLRYPDSQHRPEAGETDDPATLQALLAHEAGLFAGERSPDGLSMELFCVVAQDLERLLKAPDGGALGRACLAAAPSLERVLSMARGFCQMRLLRAWADQVIARAAPDVALFAMHHSCGNLDDALGWVCRRRGIPTAVLPVTPQIGSVFEIGSRFELFKLGTYPQQRRADFDAFNKACARFRPEWVEERDGLRLFMFEPDNMLAADRLGILQREVWQKPPTEYDLVFVQSELSRTMLAQSGFPLEKVTVSGFSMLETVVPTLGDAGHRAALSRRLGIAADEPFILFNVENGAEHNLVTWDVHWERFRALMSAVATAGWKVVLSLHPTCELANYRFAEAEFGVAIATQDRIHDLYPWCAFAVSYPSSVNMLADVFNKPLIVYDWYDFLNPAKGIGWMYELPGARSVKDADGVRDLIGWAKAEAAGRTMDYGHLRPASRIVLDTVSRFLDARTDARAT